MTDNAKEQSNHSHQPMHVVCASNDGYAVPLGVSLYSLFEHNADLPLAVHIFSDGISEGNIEKFRRTAAAFNREVDIRPMPDLNQMAAKHYNDMASDASHDNRAPSDVLLFFGQLSLSTYLRLFLVKLLPSDVDKVLWLDADTVVTGSIAEWFTMDISAYAGAGCLNVGARNKRLHGFGRSESYYNAGIFMLNMDYWRARGVYDAVLGEMKRRRGKAIDHDQDYLNCVLRSKVLTVDPRYNFMTHYYWMTEDYGEMLEHTGLTASEMYTSDVLQAARQDVRIYHIIDGTYGGEPRTVRPWLEGYRHPFADVWREEAAKTLWRDAVPPLHGETVSAIAAASTPSLRAKRSNLCGAKAMPLRGKGVGRCERIAPAIASGTKQPLQATPISALRRIRRRVRELFMYRIPLTRKIYVRVKYGFWHK